ncbi:MAG: Hsp20/alpha crystallin family protein [Syntrophobacteraceae bacterium]
MAAIIWRERPESERPGRILERLQGEVNRLMSTFSPGKSPESGGVFPPANISEEGENLIIRAEMPGIAYEEIEVSVEDESVTIRGERKVGTEEDVNYHRREREGGRFRRVLTLPSRIDPEQAAASFKNGILKVVLPKVKETEPRQVKVMAE